MATLAAAVTEPPNETPLRPESVPGGVSARPLLPDPSVADVYPVVVNAWGRRNLVRFD